MGKNLAFHETHPDTGKQLTGFQLPNWDALLSEALELTAAFSGIPIQAWDIALTDKGPIFLEVNIVGSVFLPQLASQKGFLDQRIQELSTEVMLDREKANRD